MTIDTDNARRAMLPEVNAVTRDSENRERTAEEVRQDLEAAHGEVLDTAEMRAKYEPLGFGAPFVVVRRRADGVRGSLEFTHSPRFYFNFQEDR